MGSGNSQEATSKTQWKQTGTNRRVPPNSYKSYPGIYPPATNEYPPYYSNYPSNYHGNNYQNQYYPQQQMMPNGYETLKQPYHQQNDHSSHRHHKHHRHRHHHHHHPPPPRVRNQQQQTQQNSREFAAQTTPTLFLGDNPDEIPRSTPALLRESSSMESLDEKSLHDEVNPIPPNPPSKSPSVPPPKSSSSKVVVMKVLSPKVSKQQPSPTANPPRSTPAVPQKPATPILNPWPNPNGWPAYNRDNPTMIPNMTRHQ